MTKLNGWKRIGIIVSIVWILWCGIETYSSQIDTRSDLIAVIHASCDNGLMGKTGDDWKVGFQKCDKEEDDSLALARKNALLMGAIFAFVPVPFGWGFIYLLLFLLRWVKHGFAQQPNRSS